MFTPAPWWRSASAHRLPKQCVNGAAFGPIPVAAVNLVLSQVLGVRSRYNLDRQRNRRPNQVTRKARRNTILIVVVAIVIAGVWYLTSQEPLQVATTVVQRGTVEATVTNTRAGSVKARRRAKIAPLTSGQVIRLPVEEGESVEAGQVLLELWNDDRRAQLALARSQAKAARARVEQACTRAEQAAREAARQETLRAKGLTSEEAVDRAVTERQTRQAACKAAGADAEVAQEQVDVARAALDMTILRAPFAGVVAEVAGELGEVVSPSPPGIPTPPAIDLIEPGDPYVSAPIDEVDAPAIKVGMPARIRLDAFGDRAFEGRVQRIAPYVLDVEKQARTVEVEVSFSHSERIDGLLPGYSADAVIILDAHRDVLRVPTEAVLDGPRVLVLDDEQVIRERAIETGITNWDFTEVTRGLEAGEQIVLSVNREGVGPGVSAVVEGASASGP